MNASNSKQATTMYSYIANGIPLQSEIEFPELQEATLSPRITIRLGAVPSKIDHVIYKGPTSEAGKNQYLLRVKNVGTYFLEKKEEQYTITIAPLQGVPLKEIRIFILSSMLGAVCYMEGFLPLHASGVAVNGKAILFCGKSGLGKSTLSASLYLKDNSFVTDNLAAIFINEEGIPMVHPSYSHFRLWKDSIDMLGNFGESMKKMRNGVEKFNLLINNNVLREAIPLGKIYHLNRRFDKEILIEPLKGRKKADVIVKESFRIKLLNSIGVQTNYFNTLNQICATTEVAKIYRPSDSFSLDELNQKVLEDIKKTVTS